MKYLRQTLSSYTNCVCRFCKMDELQHEDEDDDHHRHHNSFPDQMSPTGSEH